jgi:putative colanic acid biosynthesis acetyltransferase WcaF
MGNIKLYGGYFLNFLYNDIVTHIPIHIVRKSFLRLFNTNISYSSVILMHVRIMNFWNVRIGNNSIINQYVSLDCRRYSVFIEDNVDIGPYTKIWTLSHDPHDNQHHLKGGDVRIKHHAWIASGVVVLPNLCIAEGAVVAAGSVVTKDVEAKTIVAGVPAIPVGLRTNDLSYTISYNPIFE